MSFCLEGGLNGASLGLLALYEALDCSRRHRNGNNTGRGRQGVVAERCPTEGIFGARARPGVSKPLVLVVVADGDGGRAGRQIMVQWGLVSGVVRGGDEGLVGESIVGMSTSI